MISVKRDSCLWLPHQLTGGSHSLCFRRSHSDPKKYQHLTMNPESKHQCPACGKDNCPKASSLTLTKLGGGGGFYLTSPRECADCGAVFEPPVSGGMARIGIVAGLLLFGFGVWVYMSASVSLFIVLGIVGAGLGVVGRSIVSLRAQGEPNILRAGKVHGSSGGQS